LTFQIPQNEEPVVALGAGVGDARLHERVDLGPPFVDGAGQGEQFGDLRVNAPGQEAVQSVAGEVRVAADPYGRQQGA
jgi:hypothetical protein